VEDLSLGREGLLEIPSLPLGEGSICYLGHEPQGRNSAWISMMASSDGFSPLNGLFYS